MAVRCTENLALPLGERRSASSQAYKYGPVFSIFCSSTQMAQDLGWRKSQHESVRDVSGREVSKMLWKRGHRTFVSPKILKHWRRVYAHERIGISRCCVYRGAEKHKSDSLQSPQECDGRFGTS